MDKAIEQRMANHRANREVVAHETIFLHDIPRNEFRPSYARRLGVLNDTCGHSLAEIDALIVYWELRQETDHKASHIVTDLMMAIDGAAKRVST